MGDSATLRVGSYVLAPVRSLVQEDASAVLGAGRGVYVCNCPMPGWYSRFGGVRSASFSADKKARVFALMAHGSVWVSPTFDAKANVDSEDWHDGRILHVGYGRLRGRLAQLRQTWRVALWLLRHRAEYEYCLVYNYDLPYFLGPLAAKVLLRKQVVVDYEDDATLLGGTSAIKRATEKALRRTVDGAICCNTSMRRYFDATQRVCVINSFADLTYARGLAFDLREGMTFLYSGRLDEIRGIDLVPIVVEALRTRLSRFFVRITGDGPLRQVVESWSIPEVEYLGFLEEAEFAKELDRSDACLILQKPDHPFSRGSFPSKIEAYARHRKPIFMLRRDPIAEQR